MKIKYALNRYKFPKGIKGLLGKESPSNHVKISTPADEDKKLARKEYYECLKTFFDHVHIEGETSSKTFARMTEYLKSFADTGNIPKDYLYNTFWQYRNDKTIVINLLIFYCIKLWEENAYIPAIAFMSKELVGSDLLLISGKVKTCRFCGKPFVGPGRFYCSRQHGKLYRRNLKRKED